MYNNKFYINNVLTSQSPFNFYSIINIFKKQIDFIDYKSITKSQKLTINYALNTNLLPNLTFYSRNIVSKFYDNSNFIFNNTQFSNNSLSGNTNYFNKNINFNT